MIRVMGGEYFGYKKEKKGPTNRTLPLFLAADWEPVSKGGTAAGNGWSKKTLKGGKKKDGSTPTLLIGKRKKKLIHGRWFGGGKRPTCNQKKKKKNHQESFSGVQGEGGGDKTISPEIKWKKFATGGKNPLDPLPPSGKGRERGKKKGGTCGDQNWVWDRGKKGVFFGKKIRGGKNQGGK